MRRGAALAALLAATSAGSIPSATAQAIAEPAQGALARSIGGARVLVDGARSVPGGVLSVSIASRRWATANTLLDGRRGSLMLMGRGLFGLVPIAVDTEPGPHTLSIFLPGRRGRGAQGNLTVQVDSTAHPTRLRPIPATDLRTLEGQALRDARALLAAIREREAPAAHTGVLKPPLDSPVGFPFGGIEDFGSPIGPAKDGLSGEHHRGVDYFVPPGTAVRAPGAGRVVLARSLAFSGGTVAIAHGRGLVSVLSHLGTIDVREGETVLEGSVVAVSAPTGWGAQGLAPHVCFATYLHSLNVDPAALLDPRTFEARR